MGARPRCSCSATAWGSISAYLALEGYDVTYCEPGRMNQAFARAVFAASGANVRILESAEGLARGAFDAVICLDVLEHVPDPPGLVGMLAGGEARRRATHRPRPLLLSYSADEDALMINRRFSGNLSRLYRPHGLRLLDGRFFWDPIVLEKIQAGTAAVAAVVAAAGHAPTLGRSLGGRPILGDAALLDRPVSVPGQPASQS